MRDLAQHFKDGTLSAAKFALWDEEEVSEKLIAVRGIGPVSKTHTTETITIAYLSIHSSIRHMQWTGMYTVLLHTTTFAYNRTVHMFSMFSLRRPDVLGSGDLGLQKVLPFLTFLYTTT